MKTLSIWTAFLVSFSAGSFAADLPEPPTFMPSAPPYVQQPSYLTWITPYIGVHAGYGISKLTVETCCGNHLSEDFPGGRLGAFIGQNWVISGGFISGIEGDVGYDWNSRAFNGANEVGTGWTSSARVRFGQESGKSLLYVAGGWTGADVYLREPDDRKFAHGWTVGAGVDWAINDRAFVRTEYRFNKFGDVKLRGVPAQFDQSAFNIGLAVGF